MPLRKKKVFGGGWPSNRRMEFAEEWVSQSCFRRSLPVLGIFWFVWGRLAVAKRIAWAFYSFWRDGKIHSLSPCRCGKRKLWRGLAVQSAAWLSLAGMGQTKAGEPKLILSRIGGECKTRKSSKSAQILSCCSRKRLLAVAGKRMFRGTGRTGKDDKTAKGTEEG